MNKILLKFVLFLPIFLYSREHVAILELEGIGISDKNAKALTNKLISVDTRLVNVETGETFGSDSFTHFGEIEYILLNGMKQVAYELSGKEIILSNPIIPTNTEKLNLLSEPDSMIVADSSHYLNKSIFHEKFQGHRTQGLVVTFNGDIVKNINENKFNKKNSCLLILDQVEDPQNAGQIIRTSECAGIDGVISLFIIHLKLLTLFLM